MSEKIKSDIDRWSQLPIDMHNKIGTVTRESGSPGGVQPRIPVNTASARRDKARSAIKATGLLQPKLYRLFHN